MEYYFILKWVHIISATLIFGTGIGSAFYMLLAYLSKSVTTLKYTTSHVVIADWIFTTPAIIIQPITGIWLMIILHYPLNSLWFLAVMSLYIATGLCWIPVVFIQYSLRNMLVNLPENSYLPPRYHRLMTWWIGLGIPAFLFILIIYWLMISKSGLSITLF